MRFFSHFGASLVKHEVEILCEGNTFSRDCNRIDTCLLLHSGKQTGSVHMWLVSLFSISQSKVILKGENLFKLKRPQWYFSISAHS